MAFDSNGNDNMVLFVFIREIRGSNDQRFAHSSWTSSFAFPANLDVSV
jgi:hypothetical protein